MNGATIKEIHERSTKECMSAIDVNFKETVHQTPDSYK